MRVDLFIPAVATVENVETFFIAKGRDFKLTVVDNSVAEPLNWFANEDPILQTVQTGKRMDMTYTASVAGPCMIQLQDDEGTIRKRIHVTVFDNEAASFAAVSTEKVEK